MNEGVSIIFENKVNAIGSKERPIIFKKMIPLQNGEQLLYMVQKQMEVYLRI